MWPCLVKRLNSTQLNSTHAVWWTELRTWAVRGRVTDSEPLLRERRSRRCPWESLVGRLPPVDLQLFSVSHGFLHKALLLSTLDFLSRTIRIHVNGGVGVGWGGWRSASGSRTKGNGCCSLIRTETWLKLFTVRGSEMTQKKRSDATWEDVNDPPQSVITG